MRPCHRIAPAARSAVSFEILRWVAILTVALSLAACAVGNTYNYRLPGMALPVQGNAAIGLVVADRRPYVLSGKKGPDFVGLQRGGFGNPFDVRTQSGGPMATDMSEALQNALAAKGYRVTPMQGDPDNLAALGRKAGELGLQRIAVLHITEWKTDTYMNTTLFFDLKLLIVDPAGAVVAENAVSGNTVIGGGMPSTIAALAQQAFENKIGQLFYPPQIAAALNGGTDRRK